ncbi:MAG TPA: carboxypeptidase-like regulatory domain-containing protein, partial [Syntrophorhabdaceae bacterium]|nr:carboxypeptidase-like regulatory domain-containing protein [Syntrophorhabdaceae bacterium]
EAATCGYLNDAVTASLKGAGFDAGQIHSVVGYKDGWQALNRGYIFDVNINHVAPVVVIDGAPYSFDLWAHGGSEGSFKDFGNSAWNGIKTESWGELMRKHQGYNAFSSDEGITKKDLAEANEELVEKTKANLKAMRIEVRDSYGKPVSGARVTLTHETRYSGTTGMDGSVTAKGVKPAKYAVRVTAEGYLTFSHTAELAPMRDDRYSVTLEPILSSVVATVRSGSIPVVDAKVRMSSRSPETTGEAGDALFEKVPPGTYTLTAEAEGFAEETRKITVKPKDEKSAATPVPCNFNLKPRITVRVKGAGQAFTGDVVELEAEVEATESIKPALKYAWRLVGDNTVLASTAKFKRTMVHPGTYVVSIVVYVHRPGVGNMLVGEAVHKIVAEARRITVSLSGPGESKVGDDVMLRAQIKQLSDSDKEATYTFGWSVNGMKFGGNGETQSLKVTQAGRNTVRAVVWQAVGGKWVRAGDASHAFVAAGPDPAKGSVSVSGPSSVEVGDRIDLNASVGDTNVPASALYYSWVVNGRRYNYRESIALPASAPGTYNVTAELWMKYQPKPVKLAQAFHTVTIVKKGEKPDPLGDLMAAILGGSDKPGTSTGASPTKPDTKVPVGRAYTAAKLPANQFSLSGTWNAVDSKGRFNGKMSLSQSGSSVSGTMQTPGGGIPVSGSISGSTVSVILTFGSPAIINQYLQDMRVSQAVGSITAKATFTIGSNNNELQGTLYPFHVQWNDDGKTVIVKRKWQGGETHPGNPPRSFTLRR